MRDSQKPGANTKSELSSSPQRPVGNPQRAGESDRSDSPYRLVRDSHLLLPEDPGSLTFPLDPRMKGIEEPIQVNPEADPRVL